MDWIFDGIGTQIVSALIGLLIGGVSGYKIGIHKNVKQSQNNSGQSDNNIQIGNINNYGTK